MYHLTTINPSISYVGKSFLLHVKRKIRHVRIIFEKKKIGEIAGTQYVGKLFLIAAHNFYYVFENKVYTKACSPVIARPRIRA